MRKALLADDTERALIAVPLYHKNAMVGAVKPFLLAGGSLVILPGFDALEVIRAIDRYKVTYLTGVPAMYKMILAEKDALGRHDVTSVRYAVCGSAEVPEELLDEFRRVFGAPIGESYGLTEGGPVPIVNSRWGLKKRNRCGLAFPGCDVKLVDEAEREVGVEEVGELVTRNPGLAKGYWKLPEATRQEIPRRLALHRRPHAPRRRRLLLLRRAPRRHDQRGRARTCTPRKWRTSCSSIPTSATPAWCRRPTTSRARCRSPSSWPASGQDHRGRRAPLLPGARRALRAPAEGRVPGRAAARRHRQDRSHAPQGAGARRWAVSARTCELGFGHSPFMRFLGLEIIAAEKGGSRSGCRTGRSSSGTTAPTGCTAAWSARWPNRGRLRGDDRDRARRAHHRHARVDTCGRAGVT